MTGVVAARPRVRRWAVAGLLALAALLRLTGLGQESLWFDEAYSVAFGRNPLSAFSLINLQGPPFTDRNLYHLFLHFWLRVGTSEWLIRLPSVAFGLATVYVVCRLGAALWDEETGLLAGLLMAVSPFHVWYSQEARMYALVALCTAVGTWLFWQMIQEGKLGRIAGYVLAMALGLYTHSFALLLLLYHNLYVAVCLVRRKLPRRFLQSWLLAQLALFLLYLPWLRGILSQQSQGWWSWITVEYGPATLRSVVELLVAFGNGGLAWPALAKGALLLFCGVLCAAGAGKLTFLSPSEGEGGGEGGPAAPASLVSPGEPPFGRLECPPGHRFAPHREGAREPLAARPPVSSRGEGWKRENTGGFWLGLWPVEQSWAFAAGLLLVPVGLALALSQVRNMFVPRYMLPFLPGFVLLLARGVRCLPWRPVGMVALAALLAVAGLGLADIYLQQQKEDWRGAARWVAAEEQPGDLIFLMDGDIIIPFRHYYTGAGELQEVWRRREPEVLRELVNQAVAAHPHIWLVLSHCDNLTLKEMLANDRRLHLGAERQYLGVYVARFDRVGGG